MLRRIRVRGASREGIARVSKVALSVALAATVAGCAYPDWANPVSWYDSALGDDPPPPQQAQTDSQGYPTLSSVPAVPEPTSTPAQRQEIAEGLAADRDKARYTDEALRGVPGAPPPAIPQITAAPAPAPVLPPLPLPVAAPAPIMAPPPLPVAAPAPIMAPAPAPIVAPPPPGVPPAPYPKLSLTSPTPAGAPAPVAFQPVAAGNQSVLQQAFAAGLAQSAATVITTPTHGGFDPSVSQPLAARSLPVSELARSNYNESLGYRPATIDQPSSAFARPAFVNGGSAIASVKFRNGSSKLSKGARGVIKGAASAHKARGGRIRVVGHASQRTQDLSIRNHKVVNFRLSVDRAQSVASELMRLGVAPNAIVIEARGGGDPVYYEWMPAGEAENRRADIYLGY
jgi:outer membrane protein OmpA-like peptidoglycan-associated protein